MPSTPDPVQYDSFAAEYEEHAAAAPYNALYDCPATLRLVGDVEGRRVLDAECGPGFYVCPNPGGREPSPNRPTSTGSSDRNLAKQS